MPKVRASCLSTKLISSYRFSLKIHEVSDNLLIATRDNLCGGMDDGRGGSERRGALWAVLNVPSDYDMVNVARWPD